jgi:2-haloacid dehalogenase
MTSLLAHRPRAVVFDVIETTFSLEALRPHFTGAGLSGQALEWWFATTLRDGFALASTGKGASFAELANGAFAEVADKEGAQPNPEQTADLLRALSDLDPYPDTQPALDKLADARVPAIALSNGSASTVAALFERAGLARHVSLFVSVEENGSFKPRQEAYHLVASKSGVEPEALALVAAHPWDLHGAAAAGLVTAWVNRSGRAFPATFTFPHVQGPDLVAAVERLLALPDL